MSRLTSMSRFDENISEPNVVAECVHCDYDIYEGDEATLTDDGHGFVHEECAVAYDMRRSNYVN